MIEKISGNILKAEVQALVNPVNCVGVMGKGLALAFKQTYPNNFLDYKEACYGGKVMLGKMFITKTTSQLNPRYIINFPTKQHWKEKSNLENIKTGLVALIEEIKKLEIKSIALPPLGCGLGKLKWQEVEGLIINAFNSLPEVRVLLFLPKD